MSKAQERSLSDFELWMMKSGRANKDFEFTIGDDQEYIYSHVAEDFSVWCAAVASMSTASSEQQAAQQDAPDLVPPMGIRNDRDMLNYLMGAFDSEINYCVRCGCEEETKDMDSANLLREYLSTARASNGGKA